MNLCDGFIVALKYMFNMYMFLNCNNSCFMCTHEELLNLLRKYASNNDP